MSDTNLNRLRRLVPWAEGYREGLNTAASGEPRPIAELAREILDERAFPPDGPTSQADGS